MKLRIEKEAEFSKIERHLRPAPPSDSDHQKSCFPQPAVLCYRFGSLARLRPPEVPEPGFGRLDFGLGLRFWSSTTHLRLHSITASTVILV